MARQLHPTSHTFKNHSKCQVPSSGKSSQSITESRNGWQKLVQKAAVRWPLGSMATVLCQSHKFGVGLCYDMTPCFVFGTLFIYCTMARTKTASKAAGNRCEVSNAALTTVPSHLITSVKTKSGTLKPVAKRSWLLNEEPSDLIVPHRVGKIDFQRQISFGCHVSNIREEYFHLDFRQMCTCCVQEAAHAFVASKW